MAVLEGHYARAAKGSGAFGWSALGALIAAIVLLAVISASHGVSEFIYFNF